MRMFFFFLTTAVYLEEAVCGMATIRFALLDWFERYGRLWAIPLTSL